MIILVQTQTTCEALRKAAAPGRNPTATAKIKHKQTFLLVLIAQIPVNSPGSRCFIPVPGIPKVGWPEEVR